jgi:hypothetical protein
VCVWESNYRHLAIDTTPSTGRMTSVDGCLFPRQKDSARDHEVDTGGGFSYFVIEETNSFALMKHSSVADSGWASVRIPDFRTTAPAALQEVNNLLKMEFRLSRDPTTSGFAGTYPTGDVNDVIGPFHEVNKTSS